DGAREHRRSAGHRRGEHRVNRGIVDRRASRIVDGDKVGLRAKFLEGSGHRVAALFPSDANIDLEKREVRTELGLEHLTIILGYHEDRLANVVATDKAFDRMKPNGPIPQHDERL